MPINLKMNKSAGFSKISYGVPIWRILFVRRANLADMSVVVHNGNAVADGKRNFLVMRYIHNRYAELALQSLNLKAHFLTQVSVKA